MTYAACARVIEGVGSGVAASLQGVDCAATTLAANSFGKLFGSEGIMMPVLTVALTLYVAFFGLSLITGRSTLGISALTPRMITLGVVLTFATSWVAFQSVVWNLAVYAPDWLANQLVGGGKGSSSQLFAQKIDVVLQTLMQATGPTNGQGTGSTFSPPGLLWLGAMLLLLGTAGLLATCKIALAILLAVGPLFIVLAMFRGTRGLFVGWLKGMVMLALAPMFAVVGGSLMLELAVPVLKALAQTPGQVDEQAAMAFFLIAAVHLALMTMVLKVAGTMVSGWTVFGLAGSSRGQRDGDTRGSGRMPAPAAPLAPAVVPVAAPAGSGSRQIRVATGAPAAANDAGASAASVLRRETQVIAGTIAPTGTAGHGPARARGIGSRFRAAPPRKSPSPEMSR